MGRILVSNNQVFLCRFILGLKHGDKRQGDHVNHDTLDNRRENLRVVTNRKNAENRKNQSKYGVGVYWRKDKNKFQAQIRFDGRLKSLGLHNTPEEATKARELFLEEQSTIKKRIP